MCCLNKINVHHVSYLLSLGWHAPHLRKSILQEEKQTSVQRDAAIQAVEASSATLLALKANRGERDAVLQEHHVKVLRRKVALEIHQSKIFL